MTQVPSNPMFYEPPEVLECPQCDRLVPEEEQYCYCGHDMDPGPDPDALFDELREEGKL